MTNWPRLASAPVPTIWSHWYHYFDHLTTADLRENLAAIRRQALAVDVIEVDDGSLEHPDR